MGNALCSDLVIHACARCKIAWLDLEILQCFFRLCNNPKLDCWMRPAFGSAFGKWLLSLCRKLVAGGEQHSVVTASLAWQLTCSMLAARPARPGCTGNSNPAHIALQDLHEWVSERLDAGFGG